jgi:hypothetical protein
MLENDYDSFCEVIVGFAELKGREMSAAAIKLYWAAMQHWELDEFRQAAEQLLRTCTFMPTPKDFEDLRKAALPTPGEAWATALEIGRHGGRTSGDRLIDRAVRAIGGYNAIGMSEVDKTHFLERRFCEHYEAMQDAQETRDALPDLSPSPPRVSGPARLGSLLPGLQNAFDDGK